MPVYLCYNTLINYKGAIMRFFTRFEFENMSTTELIRYTNRLYARINKRVQSARKSGASEYDISSYYGLNINVKTGKAKGFTEIRTAKSIQSFEKLTKGQKVAHIHKLLELQRGGASESRADAKNVKGVAVEQIRKLMAMTLNHTTLKNATLTINSDDIPIINDLLNQLRDYTNLGDIYFYKDNGMYAINNRIGIDGVTNSKAFIDLLEKILIDKKASLNKNSRETIDFDKQAKNYFNGYNPYE